MSSPGNLSGVIDGLLWACSTTGVSCVDPCGSITLCTVFLIVLSGSTFPAHQAQTLSLADRCCTKASLSLADITDLVEEEIKIAIAPEYRNVKIYKEILERIVNEVHNNFIENNQEPIGGGGG